MNRTNRSGIIKAGVIGGMEQSGLWKLDARFNREDLIFRIKKIAENKSKIHLYNKDIKSFLENPCHSSLIELIFHLSFYAPFLHQRVVQTVIKGIFITILLKRFLLLKVYISIPHFFNQIPNHIYVFNLCYCKTFLICIFYGCTY